MAREKGWLKISLEGEALDLVGNRSNRARVSFIAPNNLTKLTDTIEECHPDLIRDGTLVINEPCDLDLSNDPLKTKVYIVNRAIWC